MCLSVLSIMNVFYCKMVGGLRLAGGRGGRGGGGASGSCAALAGTVTTSAPPRTVGFGLCIN